jgi:hypothetical protein
MINEVVANLKITRKSAIRAINRKPRNYTTLRRGKQEKYTYDLIKPLTFIWKISGYACSKKLVPEIRTLLDKLIKFNEIDLSERQERLLRQIKASSVDKLLEGHKDISQKEYGISGTKKSPLLKTLIPVRTSFTQEEHALPGNVELDCVLHCGSSLSGQYAETLNALDIATHWNEKKIFLNKTKEKVLGIFHGMQTKQFPFSIKSVDFDNGTEFVNWKMYEYCQRKEIAFTRCRSYHKNDQAHIEGKNYHSVRKLVGYDRITDNHLIEMIDDVYQNEHRLLTNFFYSTLKLKEKHREGGKVTKRYEQATTPYARVLQSDLISQEVKDKLKAQYDSLNPAQLQRSMEKKLSKIYTHMRLKKLQNMADNSVTVSYQATPLPECLFGNT